MSLQELREVLRTHGDRSLRELAFLESAKSKSVSSAQVALWKQKEGATVKNEIELCEGQFWAINGYVYRIESLNGGDAQYPIVMVEVYRAPEVRKAIEATLAAVPEFLREETRARLESKSRMTQELAWFIHRKPERVYDLAPWLRVKGYAKQEAEYAR